MNDDWTETTLGAVAEIVGGGTPSTSEPSYWGDDVVWLTPTEVVKADGTRIGTSGRMISASGLANSSAKMLPRNTVLLTTRASVGFVALADCALATNQGFQSLIPGPCVTPEFLMYWVQGNRTEFSSRAGGSTFPEIGKSKVQTIPISLPPLPVQRRIVDLMAHLDNQIANLRTERDAGRGLRKATLSTLLDATREIPADYDAAFDLADSAPQASPTSDQAMNKEWTETTLGDCCTITIGRTPPRGDERYWTQDLSRPFCTISDMNGELVDPSREGVTELAEAEGKAKRFPAGALLMSFKLTIGRMGFAARDLFPNEAIAWLDVQDPTLDVRFLSLWLASQDLSEGSGRAVKGNTLNSSSMNAITVPIPPLPVQRRIVDLMAHLDNQIAGMDVEVSTLESLRRQLLASLLSQGVELPASDDLLLDGVA